MLENNIYELTSSQKNIWDTELFFSNSIVSLPAPLPWLAVPPPSKANSLTPNTKLNDEVIKNTISIVHIILFIFIPIPLNAILSYILYQ